MRHFFLGVDVRWIRLQISDEEIERILSGKDFEEEEKQQQQQQTLVNADHSANPYHNPGFLPYLSPGAVNQNAANALTQNSVSSPAINGFRGAPVSAAMPMAARNLLAGASAPSQFIPQLAGVQLR